MRYPILNTISRPRGRAVCAVSAMAPAATGYQFSTPVCGRIELLNTGEKISAQGRLQTTVVLDCNRCLRAHSVPLDVVVDEICSLEQLDEPQADQGDGRESCPIPIRDGEVVDLRELVRQLLILNVPPRSLCQPDCLGLCPQCGQDLNEDPCGCGQQQVDSRLAPLQELLQ